MGKKSKGKSGDLGRALLRDRFGSSRAKCSSGESSMLHTADIEDGYKWDRLDLKSVTEESSFQEFLSTAQLAGTEFHAEKLNIKFINPKSNIGLLSDKEKELLLESHRLNKDVLKIPRRPKWDETTSGYELQNKEKEQFLEWRRTLALVQEAQELTMTPYEKNLEFWRQLWRVVERSDIIVQIVDARNPLLFRCDDLERYVKEVDANKINMILVNKADFLTAQQRKIWTDYFTNNNNTKVAFFSATLSAEESLQERKSRDKARQEDIYDEDDDDNDDNDDENYYNDDDDGEDTDGASEEKYTDVSEGMTESSSSSSSSSSDEYESANEEYTTSTSNKILQENEEMKNSSQLLNREKLLALFKRMYKGETTFTRGITTVGLVGYPNVGKSSTINALLMDKKVSVSATPGKTKHFQTLYVDDELLLCDCPGLVMPSFVCTKAEMVLNGILPIDQLRDHVPAVTLVGSLIPRDVIEDTYGIMLPLPVEGEEPNRPPTAEEILNTYGYNRGFMTQNGQPDNPRSARYILKDFVNGKLLYCVSPPAQLQSEFHKFSPRRKIVPLNKVQTPRSVRASRGVRTTGQDVDKLFFQQKVTGLHHVRGSHCTRPTTNNGCSDSSIAALPENHALAQEKPWKKINKHANKKKREKSRRLYAHLDQH